MDKKTVYILIPGIRTNANIFSLWTHYAVNWINRKTDCNTKAVEFDYHCNILNRFIAQRRRSTELSNLIGGYRNDGYRVIVIAHSNGCALVAMVLLMNNIIDYAHLISPAAFAKDYSRAFRQNVIKKVFVYGSDTDGALLISKKSTFLTSIFSFFSTLIGGPSLGYGTLGLDGPKFEKDNPLFVKDCSINGYGHSTWLDDDHIDDTLSLIMKNQEMEDTKDV